MMSTPAHKQWDPKKRPGQIVNDVTLSDYYARKMKEKLTFREWFESRYGKWDDFEGNLNDADMEACWNAAQENS
jgi:hypothetical protein